MGSHQAVLSDRSHDNFKGGGEVRSLPPRVEGYPRPWVVGRWSVGTPPPSLPYKEARPRPPHWAHGPVAVPSAVLSGQGLTS